MKTLMVSMALVMSVGLAGVAAAQESAPAATTIAGAGGSSPAILFKGWGDDYQAARGVTLTYDAVNSTYGIQKIEAKAVDFGDTEAPLTDAELDAKGLTQFPIALIGVTLVTNVPGVESGKLRLDGPLMADIFSGAVTMWNDPKIKALNPGLPLPDWAITVAHRSDPAALTGLLTTYLSGVSPSWKAGPGSGNIVTWPAGVGGKGNGGIAEIMSSTMGTIGYVEYAYAKEKGLDLVLLKSHDGAYVAADTPALTAAAAGADWSKSKGFYTELLNQPGANSWPIIGASFVLLRKDTPAARRQEILRFFDYSYSNGDAHATALGYAPLPASLKKQVRASWGKDAPSAK